jgi:hypothetical protein
MPGIVAKNGGVGDADPFTTWPYRAEGALVKSAVGGNGKQYVAATDTLSVFAFP